MEMLRGTSAWHSKGLKERTFLVLCPWMKPQIKSVMNLLVVSILNHGIYFKSYLVESCQADVFGFART